MKINRLLLTGAAGGLGKVLRDYLPTLTHHLRLSDISDLGAPESHEQIVLCDLADFEAVHRLLAQVDAVVHLGGISTDGAFEPILQANIRGVYNLYEAARQHGVGRVVFASSNHVIGFHKVGDVLDANSPVRPDGNYGVSKAFGESLSRYYFDRYGIETVCLRIGSSFPKPVDHRMLSTWLSYKDLCSLIEACLTAPRVGHTIAYGASANSPAWWDNSGAAHLGWKPVDSAEAYRTEIEATVQPLASDDPARIYQGGKFVKAGPFTHKSS